MSRSVGFSLPAGILGRAEGNFPALTGERAGRVEAVGLVATDLDGVGEEAARCTVRKDRTTGIENASKVDKRPIAGRGREELIGRSDAEKNPEFYQFGRAVPVLAMHIDVSLVAFPLLCGDVGPFPRHYGCWSGQSSNSGLPVRHG